jgi:hypothetical protein
MILGRTLNLWIIVRLILILLIGFILIERRFAARLKSLVTYRKVWKFRSCKHTSEESCLLCPKKKDRTATP